MLYWHWIAAGFTLMVGELVLPSFFFMWLGTAALAVGVIVLLFPDLDFMVQGGLFAVMGVGAFYLSRRFIKSRENKQTNNTLNKRGASLIGQIVILETAIENGKGRAHVGDSLWSVEGADAPAGSRVKIVATDGTVLKVETIL